MQHSPMPIKTNLRWQTGQEFSDLIMRQAQRIICGWLQAVSKF